MLEGLAGKEYYCFLDGFSGYFQIPIDPKDQEKTTFTCSYGMFAYLRMPFGLCNAPGTFQRCMMVIFHDMIEKTMEVFVDDFSVFGNSFENCLSCLDKMLKRCEDTNLYLNWEKSHFMVKEGIVLGHKISKNRIEVDKAKVDVIAKLPHPTTVKDVRSFLGHAGKDNGENIMKSIKEGPFHMGTVSYVIAGGTEGVVQQESIPHEEGNDPDLELAKEVEFGTPKKRDSRRRDQLLLIRQLDPLSQPEITHLSKESDSMNLHQHLIQKEPKVKQKPPQLL
ncbi:reverse transcriptase domain-containing protein [Tanacetum coccineum]